MSTTEDFENNRISVFVVLKDQPTVNSALVTTFECISNELLMEVFDLLDWYSLYLSFSSLNSRFDGVLAYYHNICIDLDCIPPNKIMSHLVQHLPALNPRRIKALRSSIDRHIKLVLRDDFTLDHFIFIRSLTLIKIKRKTAAVLCKGPIYRLRANLVYLFVSFNDPNIWFLFLSVYYKLRHCFLPNATFSSQMIYLQSNTVQVLQISHEQSKIDVVATSLLAHSFHLRRLNLHVATDSTSDQSAPPFVRPSSLPSSRLSHLTVNSALLSFSSIEWLLAYAPHLRTLHVRATSTCERMFNPKEWEQVLSSGIKKLDVKIQVKEPTTLPLEIEKNDDFWQSRRWYIATFVDPSPYLHMHS
jgi:hypothetical protein